MEILIVGDHLIGSAAVVDAVKQVCGDNVGPVREVALAGEDSAEQHAAQQIMEVDGPGAVRTPTEVVEAVGDAEVITAHFAPIPAEVLAAGERLKAVVVARAGYENVDVTEATRRGIAVVNVTGRNANAVAEQALGFMLAEMRDLARHDATIKTSPRGRTSQAGGWSQARSDPTYELYGRTIGMIGFGEVGYRTADRLRGFDVDLLVYDPYVDAKLIESHGGRKVDEFERIFRDSDVVVLHARLTEETRRFIGREQFELMKPTAYFINNARSRLVDYEALYGALAEHRIAGAALDVHDDEPLADNSPWRSLDNVTLAPHTAGYSEQVWENSARLVAEAINELATTGQATNTVNADALGQREA